MEPQRFRFKGLLLDMDGTVIDTTPAIIKHWTAYAPQQGIGPEELY